MKGAVGYLLLSLIGAQLVDLLFFLVLVAFGRPRRLAIRLTTEALHVRAQAVDTRYLLDQIVRCEAVDYKPTFWHGVQAPGMEFPSSVIRVKGNRGIRLDLNDGLHVLIGSEQPDRLVELIRGLKSQPLASAR
jgi:hypothetical protein